MQSLVEDKRLDLDLPLLSVRRHSVPPPAKSSTKPQEPAMKPSTPSWTSAAPFYKSDLKSGPVRNPGVVPFVWEQKPGQPKTGGAPRNRLPPVPLLPPGWIPSDAEPDGPFSIPNYIGDDKPMEDTAVMAFEELLKVKEEEDNFSDAVETLSRTESFFMNCSLSGISGIPDAAVSSGSFSTDPQVRDLMMHRFLPAAQAMATGSPQCPMRKPAKLVERVEDGENRLRRVPLPYQHRPNFVGRYPHDEFDSSDGDDNGDYYEDSGHFTSKACGLLPRLCMKSSFCLLNPMPGMKVGGRRRGLPPSTSRKISSALHNNGPLSLAENELWEAVYKHKLRLGIPYQGEGGSKSTSKSNQLGQWSDSQTPDGSSSCCHSGGSQEAFVEILNKKDTKNGKGDGSESFDKDGQNYWTMNSSHGSQQGSGFLSPTMANSVHLDSGLLPGIHHSKHNTADTEMAFRTPNEINKSTNGDNRRMEENLGLERHNGSVLQLQSSGVQESDLILCSGSNASGLVGQQNAVELLDCRDGSLLLKVEEESKINSNFHSLLPPPLPKTPSESWLSRTLPSVSAKIPSGKSSFDIHMLQRKRGFHSSSTPRLQSNAKPLESQHPQVPFVVAKQEIPCKPSILHQSQITPTEHREDSSIKCSEPQNDQILNMKPSKPPRRQIRFADVLMTPLSPRSEV
ncbi:hypothetical protein KFK09_027188 [Dendrobium nobile]|uniref:Uncharacterized protein n=1 Tax=Dendrobium nobile TaxID=94219 RepID=A0A8T3AAU3_DENNO|nr:hypothetical protein KFK09_027188 [Dendrobium nobile]